ncbi:3434_t:CDS:2, partial [Cetraspora pellucida]
MEDLTSTYLDNSTSSNSLGDNITESSTNTEYITSKYWDKVLHEDKLVRQCKNCKKQQFSINTSKLHLKKHTAKCTTQNIKFNFIKPITKEDVDNSIIDLVVGTGISFNILNNPLFHRMVNKLHYVTDTYKVPHPTTISCHLSGSIYEIRFNFIKDVMAKMPGRISLTCDGWHSTVHRCHYTAVTAKDIKSVIIDTLNNYNIKDKFFSITMDNTTTNKAVVRILQKELPNIDLISIRCICHILNLIVSAGMMEINILRQKVHKIMKYLANPLANGQIETRWNSVLDMFERYIILHPAIKEMQLKETLMPSCLEMNELLKLELTCKILKPFAIATTILSKDR